MTTNERARRKIYKPYADHCCFFLGGIGDREKRKQDDLVQQHFVFQVLPSKFVNATS